MPLILGETLHVTDRQAWRAWLEENHVTAREIWLIYARKDSGKPRIPYDHAVEEALCFGWIDSTVKPLDSESYAQRFTPRRKKSKLSALNRERVRALIGAGKMRPAGLEIIRDQIEDLLNERPPLPIRLPADIRRALMKDPEAWTHFQNFPEPYKRVRIAWITAARDHPEEYKKRLRYFVRLTAKNRQYGTQL